MYENRIVNLGLTIIEYRICHVGKLYSINYFQSGPYNILVLFMISSMGILLFGFK